MEKERLIQQFHHSTDLQKFSLHYHNGYQLIYVKKGNITVTFPDKSYHVTQQSLIFINNLEEHNLSIDCDEYERYYLNISTRLADRYINDKTLLSIFFNRPAGFRHVVNVTSIGDTMEDIMIKLGEESLKNHAYSNETSSLLIKLMLIYIYRLSPSAFPVVDNDILLTVWQIKNHIENNFKSDLLLEKIAQDFFLSPYYLSRNFKTITGYGFKQYLLLCRLSAAKELLSNTDKSIVDIALASGFSDHSNFSKYFHREIGLTPSAFRKKMKF